MRRIAMAQMRVEGGLIDNNLRQAVNAIEAAATSDCDIVVLPECLDIGWTHPSAKTEAQPIPGPTSQVISQAAKDHHIHVVAGLTERMDQHIYNAAILVSPNGEILLKHRKINVLDIARDIYSIGDTLSVAETALGTIGLNICADNFPSSLHFARSLASMGADLLLSPCAWAVDADHDNVKDPYGSLWLKSYGTISTEYNITIIGVSNVGNITSGVWQGRKCIGCSLTVGPGAQVIAQAPYGVDAETLEIVEV